ncbi:MAG: hypothetical protein HY088_04495 [Ignavibacteriales bacterium]|nr:hypothetical protein [Ignavibacteriales bacterium]
MISLKILLAGFIIGSASIVWDWLVMGLLFRKYQALTPDAWRKGDTKDNVARILVSLYFGIAMTWFYSMIIAQPSLTPGHIGILSSLGIGIICWTVFTLPVILSTGTSTNWHPMTSLGICVNSALKVLTAALVVAMLL